MYVLSYAKELFAELMLGTRGPGRDFLPQGQTTESLSFQSDNLNLDFWSFAALNGISR